MPLTESKDLSFSGCFVVSLKSTLSQKCSVTTHAGFILYPLNPVFCDLQLVKTNSLRQMPF